MGDSQGPRARSGMTLLEMAAILALIALIAGAVVGGRELVRMAELRSAAFQLGELQQGILMFRDVYGQLPGDFRGANALWTEAIDGDNDGRINGPAVGDVETYNAWNHLSLAKLIRGSYPPHVDPAPPSIPEGNLVGSFVNILHDVPYSLPIEAHYLTVTRIRAAVDGQGFVAWVINHVMGGPAGGLLPTDAAGLDAKIDDGQPLSGRAISVAPAMGADPRLNCPAADNENVYNLRHNVHNCGLWVRLVWGE